MKKQNIPLTWKQFADEIELELVKIQKKAKTTKRTISNKNTGMMVGTSTMALAGLMMGGPLGLIAFGGAAAAFANETMKADTHKIVKNDAAKRLAMAKKQILKLEIRKRFLAWAKIYTKLKPSEKSEKWAKFGYTNLKKEILTGMKIFTECPHCGLEIKMELGGKQKCQGCTKEFFFNG